MSDVEQPQIYLITPPEISLADFPDLLARVLDAAEIACVRLALSSGDEDHVMRAADTLRAVTHARDVPLVIERHVQLVERLGLDGVHLVDSARSVRAARKTLGADAIVGTYCGASQHAGMTAGEAGADYVAFGPVSQSPLGDGTLAPADLFAWWSQMIELPVVAEGAVSLDALRSLAPLTDFFGLGAEIWGAPDPLAALAQIKSEITTAIDAAVTDEGA